MNRNSSKFQSTLILLLMALTGSLFLTGCNSLGLGVQPDQARIDALAKLVYPSEAKEGKDLDILVIRHHNAITLINRTPNVYYNVQIWLNEQYVNTLDHLDIGKSSNTTHMSLPGFINKYGEVYPVGGLLTPDKNQKLLVADLFDPATGLRHHLLVQNE